MTLDTPGFDELVVVVLAGLLIIDVAWSLFRGRP